MSRLKKRVAALEQAVQVLGAYAESFAKKLMEYETDPATLKPVAGPNRAARRLMAAEMMRAQGKQQKAAIAQRMAERAAEFRKKDSETYADQPELDEAVDFTTEP